MVSFGGGKQSSTTNPSSVWKGQQPFLKDLYAQAQSLYMQQSPQIGPAAQQLSAGLMGGTGGYANNATNPAIANLMQRAGGANPYLDAQVGALGNDINQQAQRLMAQAGRASGVTGNYGGGRLNVAQGMIGQDALRQFNQGATQLRAGAYDSGQQAALGAGTLAGQNIGQLQSLFNLGMSPYTAAWMPMQNYGALVGPPTVLGGGGSSSGWNLQGSFLGG